MTTTFPADGMALTHILVVADVERSRAFRAAVGSRSRQPLRPAHKSRSRLRPWRKSRLGDLGEAPIRDTRAARRSRHRRLLPKPPEPAAGRQRRHDLRTQRDGHLGLPLDPSLEIMPGWPYEPGTPLVQPYYPDPRYEISCPSLAIPAVGPDSTLYLPLQADNSKVGGSLVAVSPDGRVRAGWPVELKRPDSEFWSVVAGSDGTVYALAIEPESGDGFSATILAIAPDSNVVYSSTIVEP